MGEIFAHEKPPTALPFTGERLTSDAAGQIEIEHFHRYFLARALCRDKDVLDIAAGEGYGSAFLSQVARSVTSVDAARDSVVHAARCYVRDNLRFLVGDARRIPLRDASIDVVVSFETIEHIYEHDAFLAEARRILRPDGVLIVSTPDRDVYSPFNSPANAFHVRELSGGEFLGLLGRHFGHVGCLLQRPMTGSAMLPDPESVRLADSPALTFERRGDIRFEACADLPRAMYRVAYASNRPVALPRASLYIETSHLDHQAAQLTASRAETRQARQAAERAEARLAAAERDLRSAEARLAHAADETIPGLQARIGHVEQRLRGVTTELEEARRDAGRHGRLRRQAEIQRDGLANQLAAMRVSTFWRLTAPARRATELLPPRFKRRTRRAAKLLYWLATAHRTGRRLAFLAARANKGSPGDRRPSDAQPSQAGARRFDDEAAPFVRAGGGTEAPSDPAARHGRPAVPAAGPDTATTRDARGGVRLFVDPGHDHSPITDPDALLRSSFGRRRRQDTLPAVDMDMDAMATLFDRLHAHLPGLDFPRLPGSEYRYHADNPMFGIGDATILGGMVRLLRPRQVIEVGSGFSSAVVLDTIDRTPDLATRCTFIEPRTERLRNILRPGDRQRVAVIDADVRDVALDVFGALGNGDVLLLDTTHVSKTGSDVNHAILQILPRLRPGVVVHFHDVFDRFEYPDEWIFAENRAWNEQYMLRAFLMYNQAFEALFASHAFIAGHPDVIRAKCPRLQENPGGSFWLRKR